MSHRYPNANYPEAYAEANMVKATDVSVNVAGGLLTITAAGAGFGPLFEMDAVTGEDVNVDDRRSSIPEEAAEAEAVEAEVEVDAEAAVE